MAQKKPERILSIQKIQGVGNWQYSIPSNNPPKSFERINLIYGPNGSGKTSLANMFYGLSHDWPDAGHRTHGKVSLRVGQKDDATARNTDQADDTLFSRVHVFTRDMVKRSHALTVDEASMSTILTLGEERIDRERRISQLKDKLDSQNEELAKVEDKRKRCVADADGIVAEFQERIYEALSVYKGWRTKGSFNSKKAKEQLDRYIEENLEKIDALLESDDASEENAAAHLEGVQEGELEACRQILAEGQQRQLTGPNFISVNLVDETNCINQVLLRIPNVIEIDTLVDNPQASNWVQEGILIHEESDRCIFCGASLGSDRMDALRAHFSHEIKDMQRSLRSYRSLLDGESDKVSEIRRLLDSLVSEFSDRNDLRQVVEEYEGELDHYLKWVGIASRIVENKLNDVMMASPDLVEIPEIPDSSKLSDWIETYNRDAARQADRKENASDRIYVYYCARYSLNYREVSRLIPLLRSEYQALRRDVDDMRAELSKLSNREGDPLPSAQSLNVKVADLLGRDELRFEVDGDNYQVMRNGQPATRLSEGEQTAITFVHFVEMVEVDVANGNSPIVVIDDPVSSLDERIQYGVASMLKAIMTTSDQALGKLVASTVSQLFVLTHSFDFFRYLFCFLPRDQEQGPMCAYEIVSLLNSNVRQPALVDWLVQGKEAKKSMEVFSSYHHAFGLLGRTLCSKISGGLVGTVDLQLLYPNLARRLLEQFLAFEYPQHIKDFAKAIGKAGDRVRLQNIGARSGLSEIDNAISVCEGIVRPATNIGSHNRMPTVVSIHSGQSLDILIRQVFYFMYLVDRSHFEGMCEALKFDDPYDLLPASARPSPVRP